MKYLKFEVPEQQQEAYIERVRLFEDVFEGYLYELNGQKAIDFYAPKFVYERVIAQLDEFLNFSFEEHPIYTEFIRKIKDLGAIAFSLNKNRFIF